MIIDFHTHIFPPEIKNNRSRYVEQDPCFAVLYSDKKAKMATAEELISSMDKAVIDKSVILNIGWTTHEFCVETNNYILESISRYPDRLIGFCSVQPLAFDAALEEVGRCAAAGCKGVGELRPDIQLFDLMDEQVAQPLVDIIRKHNLVLLTHSSEPAGHDYPGKGACTPDMLYPFIATYPDIKTVCAHWAGGLPFYSLMPEVDKAMKNTYFDSAASPYLYRPEIYQHVSQLVGAEKILLGSDFPLIEQKRALKELEDAALTREEKELIGSVNALKLLGIE